MKPGLANPAPVSSRASAAAASVAVVSDADSSSTPSPTGGFFGASAPVFASALADAAVAGAAVAGAALADAAVLSAFSGLTDLKGLSGFTGPSGSGNRCGLVTLAGVKTLGEAGGGLGGALPSDPPSEPPPDSCLASPLGAVASERFSGRLVNTESGASLAAGSDEDPFWLLP
ncbi:MAG TPA: hypothetical protein VF162_10645 [Streptosporangiaceae bacterium]